MWGLIWNLVGGAILAGIGASLAFSGSEGLAVLGWIMLVVGGVIAQVTLIGMGVALGLATHHRRYVARD